MRSAASCIIGLAAGLLAGWGIWGAGGERPDEVDLTVADGSSRMVSRIVDGDTIVLDTGLHVRYIGADTPEIFRFVDHPEPFASDASEANRALVEGKEVRLELEKEKLDKHGRLLAHVYVRNENPDRDDNAWLSVEEELVRKGLARATYIKPNVRNYPRLKHLEDEARAASAGIWGQKPGTHGSTTSADSPYTASSLSTVYHKSDCSMARRIDPGNLLPFASRESAEASGRKPCSICKPGAE